MKQGDKRFTQDIEKERKKETKKEKKKKIGEL